jgi:hypothetical protein
MVAGLVAVNDNIGRGVFGNSLFQSVEKNPAIWMGSGRLFGLFPVMVVLQFF